MRSAACWNRTAFPGSRLKPGAGPRHVALHPGGRFAYLVNELNSTVAALACDRRTGAFRELQIVPTLPEGFRGASTCADIQVSPSGRFVYASNRGHDSIAIYRIDQRTGRLTCVDHAATQGSTPRSFCIDPTGRFLLAANQDSDTIVTFRIDARQRKAAADRTCRARADARLREVPRRRQWRNQGEDSHGGGDPGACLQAVRRHDRGARRIDRNPRTRSFWCSSVLPAAASRPSCG